MNSSSTKVALRFVAAINRHDIAEIASLMTTDHVFVDGGGDMMQGREALREAWTRYFQMFPDYEVQVRRVLEQGRVVALFGTARGTYAPDGVLRESGRWAVPAAWEAEVDGEEVATWRVFADLDPVRRIIVAS